MNRLSFVSMLHGHTLVTVSVRTHPGGHGIRRAHRLTDTGYIRALLDDWELGEPARIAMARENERGAAA